MNAAIQDLLLRSVGQPDAAAGPAARPGAGSPADPSQARALAEEFEAMFLAQMLAPMFENLRTDGPFGGGSSEAIYRSLMVQEYGNAIAEAGGLGIADNVQREILKLQEIE